MNSIFYFIFSFSSLISFVQFFIWKTDISIALITERYNRSFVDYPVGILWKFFYRNMWKLISCCLHTYYLKILLQKYVEISCCLHTYHPSKGPFSFQLHPLYSPPLLNVKKIRREISWLWVLLPPRNFNIFSSNLPTMMKIGEEGHWKPLISPTF